MSTKTLTQSSLNKIEGINSPGKKGQAGIPPLNGGSVTAQIERSTHLIAQRLGCSAQTIQRLAGVEITEPNSARSALSATELDQMHNYHGHSSASGGSQKSGSHHHRNKYSGSNIGNTSNINDSEKNKNMTVMQQRHEQATAAVRNAQIKIQGSSSSKGGGSHRGGGKDAGDDVKANQLPPLPAHHQHHPQHITTTEDKQHQQHNVNNGGEGGDVGTGGLSIAQQQAAFLDDAEAARQFAAQLRFRDAMLKQRQAPSVGQYNVPSVIGAERSSIYSRSPHLSLDGQTPRSSRFLFNVDLFANGTNLPGPGQYSSVTTSARGGKLSVAGRDRSNRKKLPIEKVNPRMIGNLTESQMKKMMYETTGRSVGPGAHYYSKVQQPTSGRKYNKNNNNNPHNQGMFGSVGEEEVY